MERPLELNCEVNNPIECLLDTSIRKEEEKKKKKKQRLPILTEGLTRTTTTLNEALRYATCSVVMSHYFCLIRKINPYLKMNTTKKFWYLILQRYNEHMTGSKNQKREKKKKELR
jgi:hypothetical protein